MEKQKLRKMLLQLHSELKETESVDEGGRELLQILMDDIQKILDISIDDQSRQRSSLIKKLKEAILYFEESHPTLALTMKKVIDTFSNMGI